MTAGVRFCRICGVAEVAHAVISPSCDFEPDETGALDRAAARLNDELPAERSEQGGRRRPSQADLLVELARERYRLGRALDDEPFAVPLNGPRIVRPLRGGRASVRAELAAAFAERYEKAPSATALADALLVLEGLALREPRERLELRVARAGAARYLDLGDETGRAVEITRDGWRLVESPPVLFRRTEPMLPLPAPVCGGDVDELRDLLNVSDDDWPLVLAWEVAALEPGIPHPILAPLGAQGSAKSTMARILAGVLDPSAAVLRSSPRDPTDWAVAAAASWVVALDNVSSVRGWLSDALCRAVTGDGLVRRALYTDSGISVLAFRRCVLLTAIDLPAVRGDLAQRLLVVRLEEIPDERRREDAEVQAAFEACHARVLGALLDLAVEVERADVRLGRLPRMADFARILAGVDAVLGTSGLERYLDQAADLQREALEADPFGTAVVDLVRSSGGSWSGEAGELLERIAPERPPKGWPASPRAARAALERLRVPLRAAGVEFSVERRGHERRRLIRLEEVGNQPSAPSAPSAPEHLRRSEPVQVADGPADGPPPDRPQPSATVRTTVRTEAAGHGRDRSLADGADGPIPPISGESSAEPPKRRTVSCPTCGLEQEWGYATPHPHEHPAIGDVRS